MSTLGSTFGLSASQRSALSPVFVTLGMALFCAYAVGTGQARLAIAGGMLFALMAAASVTPRLMIVVLLGILCFFGDFRRFITITYPHTGQDPILLVPPLVVVLMMASLVATRSLRFDSTLSKWVVAFLILMTLQILNPQQGGISVGIAGALFTIVPVCWYWLGQVYATEEMVRKLVFVGLPVIGVLAGILGTYQVFVGFLPFEQEWIDTEGYSSLWVADDVVRPFSWFTAASEYAGFLMMAIVAAWALVSTRKRLDLIPIVGFMVVALFLIGSRGPMVKVFALFPIVWAITSQSKASWMPRLILAAVIMVGAASYSLTAVSEMNVENEAADMLVGRNADGLLNPMEAETSTVGKHSDMVQRGFLSGFSNPLGIGLGSTTPASKKFGGNRTSSEVDYTNFILSLGLLGMVIYGGILFIVGWNSFWYYLSVRTPLALAIGGMLLIRIGGWTRGTEYFLAAFCWFMIGALDQFTTARREELAAEKAGLAEPDAPTEEAELVPA
ncbi:MAG: hypothetical protein AAF809_04360 [Bacteroidota bacterium]